MFVLDAVPQLAARISLPQPAADPAVAAGGADEPITVTRWRRFRHDRAYVQVHGDHIGFRDLITHEIRAFDGADAELIARVTAPMQRDADARRRAN